MFVSPGEEDLKCYVVLCIIKFLMYLFSVTLT